MGRWEILTVGARFRRGEAYVGQADVVIGRDALRRVRVWSANMGNPPIGKAGRRRGSASLPRFRQAGVSLVEMSVALFLLTAVAVFGFQTMISGWMLQNSSIMQSMTDAYAGIETAYAQRWTFANIPASGRWPIYPQSNSTVVTIGKTPKGPVNATVVRTSRQYTDPLTLAQSYMLESYVVYKDELRQYCKVSKVYRTE
jgi:hypothetical protein